MNEDLCIDDFAIEDELKIDDFLIENDLGGQAMPRVDGPVYADTYFIRIEGTVSGPHALNKMGSLADSGRLTKRHQVRKGDTGRWLTIIDFPEIIEIMKASSSAVQQVLARSESHQRTAGQNGATTSQARATRTNASPKDEPGTQPSTSNDTAGSRPSSRPRSNIASAKPKQRGRKSAGRNSGSHKASKELRRLRAENARLRKQQAEDPDLQSIFDEVAQKSASATSARQTTPATTAAGAVTANMVTAQVPDRVTNASAASPLQGEPPQPQPHHQMTPQAATPRQPPVSPAFAARPPIPKQKKPRYSAGFLRSLAFDKSKLMAGGGILVVAMLLFFSPQVLGILSFGSFIPDQTTVEATLKDYFARYEALEGDSIDPDAWKEFGDEVRGTAGGWIKSYRAAAGRRSERDIALQQAATTMVQITNCNVGNAEQRLKLAAAFSQQIQSR